MHGLFIPHSSLHSNVCVSFGLVCSMGLFVRVRFVPRALPLIISSASKCLGVKTIKSSRARLQRGFNVAGFKPWFKFVRLLKHGLPPPHLLKESSVQTSFTHSSTSCSNVHQVQIHVSVNILHVYSHHGLYAVCASHPYDI